MSCNEIVLERECYEDIFAIRDGGRRMNAIIYPLKIEHGNKHSPFSHNCSTFMLSQAISLPIK
ncbi:hypothetical protein [Parvimonas micra]|uniref:hypothetical protein n=1 Tax=Parvimonas micra TaxID=33033 RepID=UPI00126805E4|nr:hypothetical protein [Parvimonas micra]